jgi:hypothetical protein
MSGFIPEWSVELRGDSADLRDLAARLQFPELSVTEEDERFYLWAAEFAAATDAAAVLQRAQVLLETINGLAKAMDESFRGVEAGVIRRSKEGAPPEQFVVGVGGIEARARIFAVGIVGGASAVMPPRSAFEMHALQLATHDTSVRKALRLFGRGDRDWGELYKVYEVVQADVGGRSSACRSSRALSRGMRAYEETFARSFRQCTGQPQRKRKHLNLHAERRRSIRAEVPGRVRGAGKRPSQHAWRSRSGFRLARRGRTDRGRAHPDGSP